MRAEIYVEDAELPMVGANIRFVFGSRFEPDSPAHQLVAILKTKLDEMAAAGELQALSEASNDEPASGVVEVSE